MPELQRTLGMWEHHMGEVVGADGAELSDRRRYQLLLQMAKNCLLFITSVLFSGVDAARGKNASPTPSSSLKCVTDACYAPACAYMHAVHTRRMHARSNVLFCSENLGDALLGGSEPGRLGDREAGRAFPEKMTTAFLTGLVLVKRDTECGTVWSPISTRVTHFGTIRRK